MFAKYMKIWKQIAFFVSAFLIIVLTGIIGQQKAYTASTPSSFYLSGIIRDFEDTHPDFERAVGDNGFAYGLDPDIVLDTLDSNKKPRYQGSSYSTTNRANFTQWFKDVSGVNKSTPYNIELSDSDGDGVYTYYNASFFPLDGMSGFDEQGRSHNYHFTYEIHSQFAYKGGETFEFRGDDDVWVYINGKKVIDLGGVHSEKMKTVNLDAIASNIGITPNNTYSFDLFFAERHTSQSNFKIESTIDFIQYAD